MSKRSTIAKDLRTPKYRPRVVADKRKKQARKRPNLSHMEKMLGELLIPENKW